uniref:NADH-ubiquinone oxidoreductase chain 4L n=1 Tax=Pambolus sp. QL-2013 TaxID=1421597 RepID=A0A0A6ZL79_9HYME|nr:NADH dehydrogenase subunit 4L [Pambolus sp. QL-2013]
MLNKFIWMNMFFMNFLISSMMFSFYYKHILLTLISLEFMMINLMLLMYMMLNYMNMNLYFPTFFLTISICEGILGLSIMVYLIRNMGNDYMNILNLMKW